MANATAKRLDEKQQLEAPLTEADDQTHPLQNERLSFREHCQASKSSQAAVRRLATAWSMKASSGRRSRNVPGRRP